MLRERVESEALRSVGYDPDLPALEVEFTSGTVYRYLDVPASVYMELMTSASKGEYFVAHIRDAGFEYEQLPS
jgi:KTSC domain